MSFQRNKLKSSLEKALEEWLGEINGAYYFPQDFGMPEFLLHNIVDIVITIWDSAYQLWLLTKPDEYQPVNNTPEAISKNNKDFGFKNEKKTS